MRLVALSWARIGWAKFQRAETLSAMQFLNSAWMPSQSPRSQPPGAGLKKQGQTEKARHMYAISPQPSIQTPKTSTIQNHASPNSSPRSRKGRHRCLKIRARPASGADELAQSRTVKLTQITTKPATARFNLVFDSSPRPERADFADGDESLRPAASQLREKDFPIRFPDVSSVKIIRQAKLTCTQSACTIELLPIDKSQ